MSRRALLVGLLIVCPAAATAQTVNYLKYTPSVVPALATQPVLLEVEMAGQPTRLFVEFQPVGATQIIELGDNGTGGDRLSGDNIWTARLPVAPILSARRDDDVHRVFVGFLNVLNGPASVFRGNLFVIVYTSEAGTPPISRLSQFVQTTGRVVNIHDAAYFLNRDLTRVTREFYRWFGDDYEFINLIYDPQRFANRTHSVIKNTVEGIGLALSDNAASLGSAGRLTGISQFPIPGFFDGAETGHIHELGHQWINFLNVQPLTPGIPHWPLSSMAGGVMGFSIGGQGGQGGSFDCDVREENGAVILGRPDGAPGYNDFDLYLMGLMPPSEVRPQLVFNDPAAVQGQQCTGQVFTGGVTRVTIDDIVSRFGPRRPAAGASPTRFRVATIYVTRDELATPETMWLFTHLAARGELQERVPTHSGFVKELGRPFYLAARGRATLDMSLNVTIAGSDFGLVPTPGSRTVAAGSTATFSISAMPQGSAFENAVRFSCGPLPANAACAFSPVEVTPGTNGRDSVLTITTRSGGSTGSEGVSIVAALAVAMGLTIPIVLILPSRRRPRNLLAHVAVLGGLLTLPSCGDMGGKSGPPPPPASQTTPAGTYQIVVNGTSGNMIRSTTLTLMVQ